MPLNKQVIRNDLVSEPGYIHLDNAGASLMPRCVLETQIKHLQLEASVGGYEAKRLENQRIEAVYDSVARLIVCHHDEVAIVENASVGWMMAFYSIPFERGDRILTAEAEYASNYLAYLQIARERGVVVETIPSTDKWRPGKPGRSHRRGSARKRYLLHRRCLSVGRSDCSRC